MLLFFPPIDQEFNTLLTFRNSNLKLTVAAYHHEPVGRQTLRAQGNDSYLTLSASSVPGDT